MTQEIMYITFGVILTAILSVVILRLSWFRPRIVLKSEILERLQLLAKKSLETMDVPVGALLLYNDAIIGEGYNTDLRDQTAGGHAEINAISSALGSIGYEKFLSLDRKRLVLLSTFEPCLMCAGACVNYNIKTVYFLESKDSGYLFKERFHYARYLFKRIRIQNRDEQIALFKLHPKYPKRDLL
jgi:tRNA(Arg) A34 adenosine deaminase TadA